MSLTNKELELKTKSLVQKYKSDLSENMCQEMDKFENDIFFNISKKYFNATTQTLKCIYAKTLQTNFVVSEYIVVFQLQ